jgi:hypothetical protein
MANRSFLLGLCVCVSGVVSCSRGECERDEDCDDGLWCNGRERCAAGSCQGGTVRTCDDGVASTEDWCDEQEDRCVHDCQDLDGDGYLSRDCEGGRDCDDADPLVHPGAAETCNGVDDDCDGVLWEDEDGDGHMSAERCAEQGGDDCDDGDERVHPGADEVCNGRDENCSGGTDDEADTDGDGHVEEGCPSSPGGDDCDDEDASTHPGAVETCDGEDDDCDELCDEGFDCCAGEDRLACWTVCGSVGEGTCTEECTSPDGLDSCEPPAETCNGYDDDCDDLADDGFDCAAGTTTECTTTCGSTGTGTCTDACEAPLPDGCHPPAESCNGEDDDCDGSCDEGFACCAGEDVECVTTCGSVNVLPCTDECAVPGESACTVTYELDCDDGQDNDCDSMIDLLDAADCI